MISIIIPTFNRPVYLKRVLNYFGEYDFHYKILVADSGSAENKTKDKEVISLFPNFDILYLEYPVEINPFSKFSNALNHVTTPYCAFCADDDFLTPAGIRESVAFLENNHDFSAAHGYNLTFLIEADRENKQQFRWISPYAAESISHPNAGVRLEYHLSNYTQATLYAVHRTELMKNIYQHTLESQADLMLFGELLLSMLTVIYGKLKFLDIFYAARDGASIARNVPSLKAALEAGTYDAEYAKFRDCLAFHLNKQSQLSLEEAGELVDRAMAAYMKKYVFTKRRFAALTMAVGRALDRLHLPRWLDSGIRNPYRRLTGTTPVGQSVIDLSPSSKLYEDIEKIRRHVLSNAITNTGP